MRRIAVLVSLATVVAASMVGLPPAPAQDEIAVRGMINAATQDAIDNGLAFLAKQQNEDGSFGGGNNRGNIAYTSLSGLAFMAGGHQPGRGKYGHVVRKALENVLSLEDKNTPGYLHNPFSNIHGPMYGHGFAMLFLGEVHGMVNDQILRDRLKGTLGRSVELTIKCQNQQGGWRYRPFDGDADVSATICQIKALRSARNAGFTVPKKVADKCIEYVKRCQDPKTGGFRYQPQGGPPGFARTAAGIDALYSSGLYESKELEQALKYLLTFKPGGGNPGGAGIFGNLESQVHYHYGHYYAAQTMWIAGGDYWKEWYPAIRNELVNTQRPDGAWFTNQFSPEYATAMSLIILQIPNRYLPILQR
jgi:hypothetical protein